MAAFAQYAENTLYSIANLNDLFRIHLLIVQLKNLKIMKVIKNKIYIVEAHDRAEGSIKTKGAFKKLRNAMNWCEKANEANESVGIRRFVEYECRAIFLYEEVEENEEGEE